MLRDLYTERGAKVSDTPWQAYPRPQMKRDSYINLNGKWDFTVKETQELPQSYDKTILVPFCPESLLSGIHEHFPDGHYLFYRRMFTLPEGFRKDRVLLHIGAADQYCEVFVNGKTVGSHAGGYEAMTFDITDALLDENELVVRVMDDLRSTVLPYGKQTLTRGGMWYTPVSGIWQTVWMESVPENYIKKLDIRNCGMKVLLDTHDPAQNGKITLIAEDGNYTFGLKNGKAEIVLSEPRLWSPEDPYLYAFTLEVGDDRVESYFALRTLEIKTVDGLPRLCLNGKPYFFHGLLDQGYWSDGIYTPASSKSYTDDIVAMKRLGFNTLRKHIKVEPEEFYYQCDKLGMIVWQDMVNNGDYAYLRDTVLPTVGLQVRPDKNLHKDPETRKAFFSGMEATVNQLKNHPCICYWTIFNEAWGQFDSDAVYEQMKQLDDTRFIDSTSGWFRRKKTDVDSRHIYFGPWGQLKPSRKPLVLSEFGGYCYAETEHLFNPEKSYGYRTCKTREAFQEELVKLYEQRIIPAVSKGLCASIYTQVSDVEDEINGLLTYDRKVLKADADTLLPVARALQQAIKEEKTYVAKG